MARILTPNADEYYIAIGKAVVEWAALEDQMELCIHAALGKKEQEGRDLTAHMAYRHARDKLEEVIKNRWGNKVLSGFQTDVLQRLDWLKKCRDSLGHSVLQTWQFDGDPGALIVTQERWRRNSRRRHVAMGHLQSLPLGGLKVLPTEIELASKDVWEFFTSRGVDARRP